MREDVRSLDAADHIGAELVAMQLAENAAAGPEKPLKSAPLDPPASGSFRFRTKPGLRQTQINLRVYIPNPKYNDDQNRQYKNNWERNAQQVWGKSDRAGKVVVRWKDVLKPDQELYDRLGITSILFRPLPGLPEASYQTRDPDIAAYIRLRLQEPGLASVIYEEVGPTKAQLANGEWVDVLPATDEARRQMAAAAAGV